MCIRTAIKASALCMIPGVVAFCAAGLAVQQPRVFLATLALSLGGAGYVALRAYVRTGRADLIDNVEQVEVGAGILLSASFLFAFWTGLAHQGGHGIISTGVVVAISTALLAAWLLTWVKRALRKDVVWLERLVRRVFPASRGGHVGGGERLA